MLFELATPIRLDEKDSYTTNSVMLPENYKSKFAEENQKYEDWRKTCTTSEENFKRPHSSDSSKDSYAVALDGMCNDFEMSPLSPVLENNPINSDVPAWFGKGCRKLVRKRSKVKRRKTH